MHINHRDINIESENTRCVHIDHLHGHIVEHLSRKSEVAIGDFSFQEQQRGLEEVFGGFASKEMLQSLVFRAKAWSSPRQMCAEVPSIKFWREWLIYP